MPRRSLYKNKDFISVILPADHKVALDVWCEANQTTMSEVIRRAISPYVKEGEELRSKLLSDRT